jgi:hypothetical protein
VDGGKIEKRAGGRAGAHRQRVGLHVGVVAFGQHLTGVGAVQLRLRGNLARQPDRAAQPFGKCLVHRGRAGQASLTAGKGDLHAVRHQARRTRQKPAPKVRALGAGDFAGRLVDGGENAVALQAGGGDAGARHRLASHGFHKVARQPPNATHKNVVATSHAGVSSP